MLDPSPASGHGHPRPPWQNKGRTDSPPARPQHAKLGITEPVRLQNHVVSAPRNDHLDPAIAVFAIHISNFGAICAKRGPLPILPLSLHARRSSPNSRSTDDRLPGANGETNELEVCADDAEGKGEEIIYSLLSLPSHVDRSHAKVSASQIDKADVTRTGGSAAKCSHAKSNIAPEHHLRLSPHSLRHAASQSCNNIDGRVTLFAPQQK